MKPVWFSLTFAGVLIAFPALAVEQIGVAVEAKTQVVRSGTNGGEQVVRTSTPVYLDDSLRADSTGLAQIRLVDDTKIVVGPGSNVTLDDFVFSGSASAQVVTVSVTKGAFRWISGRSGSKAYKIRTPAGSIGVRGTAFDVTIQDDATDVLLLDGQVTVCPSDSACKTVRHRCEFVSFDRNGVRKKAELLKMTSAEEYTRKFPLIHDQENLNRQFRRESGGCNSFSIQNTFRSIIRALFVPPPPPPPPPAKSPPPPVVVVSAPPGNPGNGGVMGNAGSNPSGRGFGNTVRGVSDLGPGGGGNSGGTGSGATATAASDSVTGSISASPTSSPDSTGPGNSGGNGNGNGNGGGNGNANAGGIGSANR